MAPYILLTVSQYPFYHTVQYLLKIVSEYNLSVSLFKNEEMEFIKFLVFYLFPTMFTFRGKEGEDK